MLKKFLPKKVLSNNFEKNIHDFLKVTQSNIKSSILIKLLRLNKIYVYNLIP